MCTCSTSENSAHSKARFHILENDVACSQLVLEHSASGYKAIHRSPSPLPLPSPPSHTVLPVSADGIEELTIRVSPGQGMAFGEFHIGILPFYNWPSIMKWDDHKQFYRCPCCSKRPTTISENFTTDGGYVL